MAWDAGAITGTIKLDLGQYTAAVDQAVSGATSISSHFATTDQSASSLSSALQQAAGGASNLSSAMGGASGSLDHVNQEMNRAQGGAGQLSSSLNQAASSSQQAGQSGNQLQSVAGGLSKVLGGCGEAGAGLSEALGGVAEAAGPVGIAIAVLVVGFEAVKKTIDLTIEGLERLGDLLSDVAGKEEAVARAAARSGVSVEFFSQIEAAAKRVGIGVDELGMAFQFLDRSAVAATQGEKEQVQAFQSLGITTQWLAGHLNDTQAIFEKMSEGMEELPNSAERVRVAMQLLGRGGGAMMPLFAQGGAEMQESIELAKRLGATTDEESTRSAHGWEKTKAAFSDAWEGITKAAAEPFLKILGDNFDAVKDGVIQLADAMVELIPPAVRMIVDVLKVLEPIMAGMIRGTANLLQWLNDIGAVHNNAGAHLAALAGDMDKLATHFNDVTQGAYQIRDDWRHRAEKMDSQPSGKTAPATGPLFNVQADVHFDPDAAASKVAEKITPALKQAHQKMVDAAHHQIENDATRRKVSRRVGGGY